MNFQDFMQWLKGMKKVERNVPYNDIQGILSELPRDSSIKMHYTEGQKDDDLTLNPGYIQENFLRRFKESDRMYIHAVHTTSVRRGEENHEIVLEQGASIPKRDGSFQESSPFRRMSLRYKVRR